MSFLSNYYIMISLFIIALIPIYAQNSNCSIKYYSQNLILRVIFNHEQFQFKLKIKVMLSLRLGMWWWCVQIHAKIVVSSSIFVIPEF